MNIVLVVSKHDNAAPINYEALKTQVRPAFNKDAPGIIQIVVDDGNPIRFNSSEPWKGKGCRTENHVAKRLAEVASEVEKATPRNKDGVNTFSALLQAAEILKGVTGEKRILLFDSGLPTTGRLSFVDGGVPDKTAAKLLIDTLVTNEELTDTAFQDIIFVWNQLGEEAGTQDPLSVTEQKHLREFWENVVVSGAGTWEPGSGAKGSGEYQSYDFPVEPIPTDGEDGFIPYGNKVILTEKRVPFEPTKDYFKVEKEQEARDTIKEVADNIKPNKTILLAGSVADVKTSPEWFDLQLSENRARTVAKTLREFEVENPIKVVGFGIWFPNRADDSTQELFEANASENRIVVLVYEDSQEGKELLAKAAKLPKVTVKNYP